MSRPKMYVVKRYASYEMGDWAILRYYMSQRRETISETLRLILRKFAKADPQFSMEDFRKFALSKDMKDEIRENDPDLLDGYAERIDGLLSEIAEAKAKRK